jgi:hypothetical protein
MYQLYLPVGAAYVPVILRRYVVQPSMANIVLAIDDSRTKPDAVMKLAKYGVADENRGKKQKTLVLFDKPSRLQR